MAFSVLKFQHFWLFSLLLLSLMLLIGVGFALAQCAWTALRPLFLVQKFVCEYSPLDAVPLIVAFGYWLAGALSWRDRRQPTSTLFFLMGSVAFSAGLLSTSVIRVMFNLFYIALALLSPLLLHFHLKLLNRPFTPLEKYSLVFFYLTGGLLSLPLFIMPVHFTLQVRLVMLLVRILLMVAVLWTCLLLITGYNSYTSLTSRRQTRLVAFGSLFAFAPLILLSVLPQTLRIEHVDFYATFPGMLSIPIVYGYVAFGARWRLPEKRFRQAWLYYLLFTTLLSTYNLMDGLLRILLAQPSWVYTGGISAIMVIILFVPLRSLLSRLVMWIFYGNETDYAQALHYLEERFASVIDRKKLQGLLLEELVAAVRPSRAVLFLLCPDGTLQQAGASGAEGIAALHTSILEQRRLAQFLVRAARPVETARIQAAMQRQPLSTAEVSLLSWPEAALWLPLVSENRLYGLLLFGFRVGDDRFTEEDQRLLGRLTHHAGAAIRNVMMAEDLRAGQEELALANQKQIFSQEQERRRLARELHDDTIQQILGLTFRISGIRKRAIKRSSLEDGANLLLNDLDLVRRDLLDVVSQLRGMIAELRPAGLDELGLRVALEGYMAQLCRMNHLPGNQVPEVRFQIDEDLAFLSESLSICVFRVAQEALRNAFQHAQATQITVQVSGAERQVHLVVQDDGCGFHVPGRLSEFTQGNHYGLVGMWERIRAAGGELSIQSAPGQGARLTAVFPVEEVRDGS